MLKFRVFYYDDDSKAPEATISNDNESSSCDQSQTMFLTFSILQILIKVAATQSSSCADHPFFYGLCNYQICGYENAERYCPVTCGQCRSFVESSINYADTEIKLQNECSPQITQAMRCEYKEGLILSLCLFL